MTFTPLPASGSTSWMPWATDIHNAAIGTRTSYVVPDVVADGVTDDRAAIQAAIDGLPAAGHYTIWLPGLCFVGSGGTTGGGPYGISINRSNVTITGPDGAGLTSNVTSIRLVIISGIGLTLPTDPLQNNNWITSQTTYPFSGTQAEASPSVVLASGTDAANVVVGDWVFLRTGSLTSSTLNREPDCEINRVTSVSGTTIGLKWPTAKPYAVENFPSGSTGAPSSPGGAGTQTIFGLARFVGSFPIIQNVTLRGLQLIQTDGANILGQGVFTLMAYGVTIDRCDITFGKYGIGGRFTRGLRVLHSTLHAITTDATLDPVWLGPSTGCGDWVAISCRGSGLIPAKLHLHEGLHDIHYIDWLSRTPDNSNASGGSALLDIRARHYRGVYDVDATGVYTGNTSYDAMISDPGVVGPRGQVHIKRLRLRGATGTPGRSWLNISNNAVSIDPSGLDLPSSPALIYGAGVDPLGQTITVPAALSIAATGTPALDVAANGGTAWLLDQTTQEGIQTSIDIPGHWRTWQLEATVQGVGAPAGGADTVRLQGLWSQGGGSTTSGAATNFVIPDTTTVTNVVLGSDVVVGNVNLKLLRIAANAADTYASDVRIRSLFVRRLA